MWEAELFRRLSFGHVVLAAGFALLFFSSGTRYAFGLVLVPMTEDLNLSRSVLSSALTVFMLVSASTMPIVGRLIDRYSIRTVMACGAVLSACGLGLMGSVNQAWHIFALYGVLYAVGFAATTIAPVTVLMSRWFPQNTGLASSITITGGGTGQLVIISLLASFLKTIGWRAAYAIVGGINALAIPLVILAIRAPADTDDKAVGDTVQRTPQREGIRAALGTSDFWMLMSLYAVCGTQDFFVATHVVAFAQDQGISQAVAGSILAFMGIAALLGVLLSGVMADRMGARAPTLLCFALRLVLFGYIPFVDNVVAIAAFALLYGFSFTITAPLTVVFARNIYGTSRLGAISGLINMVHQVAGGLGALVGAIIFDSTGSYTWAFALMFALTVIAIASTAMVRERRVSAG